MNGSKFISDPVIRKSIFETATNIYRGKPLLEGLDRNIFINETNLDIFSKPINPFTIDFGQNVAVEKTMMNALGIAHALNRSSTYFANHPFLSLSRTFGYPQ